MNENTLFVYRPYLNTIHDEIVQQGVRRRGNIGDIDFTSGRSYTDSRVPGDLELVHWVSNAGDLKRRAVHETDIGNGP